MTEPAIEAMAQSLQDCMEPNYGFGLFATEWDKVAHVAKAAYEQALADAGMVIAKRIPPITVQDIRLKLGEGTITAHDVLRHCNAAIAASQEDVV